MTLNYYYYLVSGCIEPDMGIEGGNIIESKHLYNTITDPSKCQMLCQHNLECNYFVFDLEANSCLLKRSDMNKSFKKNSIVGLKNCGKKMHRHIISSFIKFYCRRNI